MNGISFGTTYGEDPELFNTAWFGISYRYSSTRDRLLWIDDILIEGMFYEDNEPPLITGLQVISRKSVEISFNEAPAIEFMIPENISIAQPGNKVKSVKRISDLIFKIEFDEDLINKSSCSLILGKICDNSDNCSSALTIPFSPVWAETGDVIISEIMADPLPVVSLPGKEYIELTNRTDYSLNLLNWKFKADDMSYPISGNIIRPHEILIFCLSADTLLFNKFGRTIGMKQFPGLTDAGRLIYLTDSSGMMIHGVKYSSLWYGADLKIGRRLVT